MTSSHTSITSAFAVLPPSCHRVFLIGGAQLYDLALASSPTIVDRILITRIATEYKCDTFFEDFTRDPQWSQASHQELCDWVGWGVPEGEVEENGAKYRYEMWTLHR